MNNNLDSLNNYLFEEMERLNDDETLKDNDNFEKEIKRSKAITQVASQIVQNANVVLKAKIHSDQFGNDMGNFYNLEKKEKPKKLDDKLFKDFGNNK